MDDEPDRKMQAKASPQGDAKGAAAGFPKGKRGREAGGANLSPPAFTCASRLFGDQPLQQLYFLRHRVVSARKTLDLAHRVKNRRMISTTEAAADFR